MNRQATTTVVTLIGLMLAAMGGQAPVLRIVSPQPDAVVTGNTRVEVAIEPPGVLSKVRDVTITVDGRVLCAFQPPPLVCAWNAGDGVHAHHVRAVATLADGSLLKANVHTRDLDVTETTRTDAVLVQAIVTRGGQFVRGLTAQDFEILEDGVPQTIATIASEDVPLDLVLAIDISGSMESSLDRVKAAARRLLTKLRPDDAVTLAGFNDTMFLAAERETEPQTRDRAVDLLTAWGGTALYDATVRAIDLVGPQMGRKGIIIFSDGDDRNSLTSAEAATARVQASNAMLYTIGFGTGATVPELRMRLEKYARDTGGRAFFPRSGSDLDEVFDEIVAELANQYVLSYSPSNTRMDDRWRKIDVRMRSGKYDVRARQGYRLKAPQRTER